MYPDQSSDNRLQPIGSTTGGNFPQGHTGSGLVGARPISVSSTEQQTISLHEAVSEMSKLVANLGDRLHSVLRQQNPPQTSGDKDVEESLPPLANAIRQSRYVVNGSIHQLSDILDRLDI